MTLNTRYKILVFPIGDRCSVSGYIGSSPRKACSANPRKHRTAIRSSAKRAVSNPQKILSRQKADDARQKSLS